MSTFNGIDTIEIKERDDRFFSSEMFLSPTQRDKGKSYLITDIRLMSTW